MGRRGHRRASVARTHSITPIRPHPRRRLGNGAYGVVVAAKDSANGKAVAIKKCFNIFQSLSDAKKIAREVRAYGLMGICRCLEANLRSLPTPTHLIHPIPSLLPER